MRQATPRRRIVRAASLCMVLAGASHGLAPSPAGAADANTVVDQGWWNKKNMEAVPVTLPPPSNVGERDLAVFGAADGASAVAALKIELADDQTNPIVTLDVVDGADSSAGAIILACQTGSGWTGVQNGVWEQAPLADCNAGSVQGIPSDDGKKWTFPVAPLQFGSKVNFLLVSGVDAAAPAPLNGSTFELVFAPPTAASIETTSGTPPEVVAPPTNFGTGSATPDAGGSSFSTPPSDSSFSDPSSSGSITLAQPALPESAQGRTATAPIVQEGTVGNTIVATPMTANRDGRPFAILILIAGLGGILWENQVRQRAMLLEGNEPEPGGLGRFVRPRTGIPPSLT